MTKHKCPECGEERERFVEICQERDTLKRELARRSEVLADMQGRYNTIMDENRRLRKVEIGDRVEAERGRRDD